MEDVSFVSLAPDHSGSMSPEVTLVHPGAVLSPEVTVLSVPPGSLVGMALTDTEAQMLDLERSWWKYAGAKERVIRERFGLSATQYYQRVNALLDREDALAHDPLLVKRLQRLRAKRQRQRAVAMRPYGY